MARFFDIDEANATLGELESMLATVLAEQRAELVRLRDHALARTPGDRGRRRADSSDDELARSVFGCRAWSTRWRPVWPGSTSWASRCATSSRGLVDFPALVSGRQVWLCWRRGEAQIGWWHDLDTGFSSRRPLSELA